MRQLIIDNKIISTPLIDIVKVLKNSLSNGKLQTVKLTGSDIQVSCPNPEHKGGHEKRASAGIYVGDSEKIEYGTFNCFACGKTCSFLHFIAMCFECSEERAKQWLFDNFDSTNISNIGLNLPEIKLPPKTTQYMDEKVLDTFESFHPYMIQRKLSHRIIDVFQIKYDPSTQCLVFPVRDKTGKLYMLTRRSVNKKLFIIDENKEKPLYLLYYMIQHNIKEFAIVEGQIDALTAATYGMPCVATMGAISEQQITDINNSGVRVLYSMFDNDRAGNKFRETLRKKLRKDILLVDVNIDIPGKKDVNDLSEEEFWQCIEKSKKLNCI